MANSLLLVDDELDVSNSLRRLLRLDNYQIHTASSGSEALELMQIYPIKVVISDQRMPHMTGVEFLSEVKQRYPETIRIIISGYYDFQSITDAVNQGEIYKFLTKPWNNDVIRSDVKEAFKLQALRQRNKQLSLLFDSTIEAIMLTDEKGIVESVNPAFLNLTGFIEQEVVGNSINAFFFSHTDEPLPKEMLISNANSEWHGELACRKSNGGLLPVWSSFTHFEGNYDEGHYGALFIDISEQKRKEQRIEYQAYHDELTGLPNRRLFNDHLELALHQFLRNENVLAVLFIDLDRFKQVNDSLGHNVGDELLISVAKRLTALLRKGDTLARFGGDEFILVLPTLKNLKECEIVAQKIINSLKVPFDCHGQKIHISPSIGISFPLSESDSKDKLIRHADTAMYKAKELGGNNYQFFDDASNQRLKELLQIENALHEGVENEEFVVHYQPQLNPVTGLIESSEALVRWQPPQKDIIMPGVFIEVAEQTGLIVPIGQYVLERSCAQLAQWYKAKAFSCSLSVNLSARQFNDPNLVHHISQLLADNNLAPELLEVEVTESILLRDMKSSISVLSQLRDRGLRVALDDFGTGYSSLSYLRQLPIDTLKIDRSFICDLQTDEKSTIITLSLLELAKGLGLKVVAEGIESEHQFEFLKQHGCDLIQGYYVSPPVTAEVFWNIQENQIRNV